MLLELSLLNVSEYAGMCLKKQNTEYASGPQDAKILNIAKVLNMARFSICECYTVF